MFSQVGHQISHDFKCVTWDSWVKYVQVLECLKRPDRTDGPVVSCQYGPVVDVFAVIANVTVVADVFAVVPVVDVVAVFA